MSLVIDAALTMTWYFEDQATPLAEVALDIVAGTGAVAPPLWRIEVANAFQLAIRRKRIDAAYRDASIADLARLPIAIDPQTDARVWTTALILADRFGLTVYDACYLELAQRLDLPLACLDLQLRAAAEALGLPPFGK